MKTRLPVLFLALLPFAASAQTLYKCTEGGIIRYADRPCGKSAVLVSSPPPSARDHVVQHVEAPAVARRGSADPTPDDAQQQRQAQLAQMTKDRRIRELEFEIRDAERQLDDELDQLRRRKGRANNNLAGATWEGSISQEMQAVTTKSTARIDALRRELAALRAGKSAN